jgi:imidazolonepropionase-like amidohydrolase
MRYLKYVPYVLFALPTLAIKNARIITVSGATIERGTIVVENGRIKAVGENPAIPSDARVIDGAGKVVMPGIVDANARFGIPGDDNEQASEVTPEIRATEMFDPFSSEVKRVLQGGVTTACITPGAGNSIGGLCGAVKTARNGHQTILRDGLAERAALGMDVLRQNSGFRTSASDALTNIYTRRPNSRMGAVWELRHALFDARKSPTLTRVLKGELPLRVHARVENALRRIECRI